MMLPVLLLAETNRTVGKREQNKTWNDREELAIKAQEARHPSKEARPPSAGAAKVCAAWQPSLWLPRLHSHRPARATLPD